MAIADEYTQMRVVNVKDGGDPHRKAFEYEEELSGVSEGKWVIIPDDVNNIAVTLLVSLGGKGKIQTTTDPIEVVKTGLAVTGVDWDAGEVSVNTQDVCVPVTALRLVQTFAGSTKLTMRAQ